MCGWFMYEECVFWVIDASVSPEAFQGAKQDVVHILETAINTFENWKTFINIMKLKYFGFWMRTEIVF